VGLFVTPMALYLYNVSLSHGFTVGIHLAFNRHKGETMKKLFCFILIVTVLAIVFNGILQDIRKTVSADVSNTALLLDYFAEAKADWELHRSWYKTKIVHQNFGYQRLLTKNP
jgi:hypothetical protein